MSLTILVNKRKQEGRIAPNTTKKTKRVPVPVGTAIDASNQCDRICLPCSYRGVDRVQYDKQDPKDVNDFQRVTYGIDCCRCGALLCHDCIMQMWPHVKKLRHKLYPEYEAFCNGLEMYADSNGSIVPTDHLGNCCILDVNRTKQEAIDASVDRPSAPCFLGGAFVLPDTHLVIGTSLKCMDVMGLGAEVGTLDGEWHYVIGEMLAADLQKRLCDKGIDFPRTIEFLDGVRLPDGYRTFETESK